MSTTSPDTANLVRQAKVAAKQLSSKIGDEPIDIPVSKLKQKISALNVFPDDTSAIQLYRYKGEPQGGTFRVYLVDGEPQLFDAALNPVNVQYSYKSWEISGYSGTATIEVEGEQFVVKLPIKTDSPLDKASGTGDELPMDLLQNVPQPGAIAFAALKLLTPYTLIDRNPQVGTCTVEDEEGEQVSVYEAKSLTKLVEENDGQLPLEFQIYDWEQTEIDGETYKIPQIKKAEDADFGDLI
jgi:hypothetical protein